jgi:hypothetical protein
MRVVLSKTRSNCAKRTGVHRGCQSSRHVGCRVSQVQPGQRTDSGTATIRERLLHGSGTLVERPAIRHCYGRGSVSDRLGRIQENIETGGPMHQAGGEELEELNARAPRCHRARGPHPRKQLVDELDWALTRERRAHDTTTRQGRLGTGRGSPRCGASAQGPDRCGEPHGPRPRWPGRSCARFARPAWPGGGGLDARSPVDGVATAGDAVPKRSNLRGAQGRSRQADD